MLLVIALVICVVFGIAGGKSQVGRYGWIGAAIGTISDGQNRDSCPSS